MNRRNFIKSGALFVPAILIPRLARAQNIGTAEGLAAFSGPSAPPGPACNLGVSQDGTNTTAFSMNSSFTYGGQVDWTDNGTPRTICKVAFKLAVDSGDITAKAFKSLIFPSDGSRNLVVSGGALATSGNVSGAAWGTGTFVEFSFATPFTTTASATYGIVCTMNGIDGANFADILHGSGSLTGHFDCFNAAGSLQIFSSDVTAMKIYWQ